MRVASLCGLLIRLLEGLVVVGNIGGCIGESSGDALVDVTDGVVLAFRAVSILVDEGGV
jgi:hypothetical protein